MARHSGEAYKGIWIPHWRSEGHKGHARKERTVLAMTHVYVWYQALFRYRTIFSGYKLW